jgi:chromosomal replication initiator protein
MGYDTHDILVPPDSLAQSWDLFCSFAREKMSPSEYDNWIAPIKYLRTEQDHLFLEIPNIFVGEYLCQNYKKELELFFNLNTKGALPFVFVETTTAPQLAATRAPIGHQELGSIKLNPHYTFSSFIEGSNNQFVKSAAWGVAERPGHSYNPLFIHGGVGLGKTHLLHAIGHQVKESKKLKIHCMTTEEFINDLVDHLRNKTLDKMKRFYRSLDVLLVDVIQFLENRQNFEDELINTFESLINQHKQIVITSDKLPSELKLSQRLIARMEWGLVAHVAVPDIETRVAILQHKAELRQFSLSLDVAFMIAGYSFQNIRQLEGALNRLAAYCKMMHTPITEQIAKKLLGEQLSVVKDKKLSIDDLIKIVAQFFEIKTSELKSDSRSKQIAHARQVAMYLSKELIPDSLSKLSSAFGGKTHSTLLHACKKIQKQMDEDAQLSKQLDMIKTKLKSL